MRIPPDTSRPSIRLDLLIKGSIEHLSRGEAQQLIRSAAVTVNDVPITLASHRVSGDDEVHVILPSSSETPEKLNPEEMELDFVYVDDHLIVVDKPAGLAVHPGAGRSAGTLVNGLIHRFPEIEGLGSRERPGIVHRLDIDTSGLMLVARSHLAFEALSDSIKKREVDRRYLALVHGKPQPEVGIVDAPIGRDSRDPTRQAVDASGRPARTRYRVIRSFGAGAKLKSFLEIKLETGRMHQIRVHMQAIGNPVFGDQSYGRGEAVPGLSRQFLHSHQLSLTHPGTGEAVRFTSDLPEELAKALEALTAQS